MLSASLALAMARRAVGTASADDSLVSQFDPLGLGEADVGQQFVAVLAERRYPARHAGR